jgi:glycerol-3-phosphate dehydrogenase
LVKGSHIVVDKLFDHGRSYIFQNSDDRICFEDDFTNEYFRRPVSRNAIRWTYSGVRPLYGDGSSKAQEATRDYELRLEEEMNMAPLLSIIGGKITTYQRLAENALEKLGKVFPNMGQPWTNSAPLPGGDFALEQLELSGFCGQLPTCRRNMPSGCSKAME